MRLLRVDYFLKIAEVVSQRGTCPRLHVGCVLVSDENRLISVGYNSSPSGTPHCEDKGCLMSVESKREHCIRTIHAETGAVANLPHRYDSLNAYVTHEPCLSCYRLLVAANVKKVYYKNAYESKDRDIFVKAAGVWTYPQS